MAGFGELGDSGLSLGCLQGFDRPNGDAMTNLTHSARNCLRDGASSKWMRVALTAACLFMPVASHGQERGVRDQPRSLEVFGDASGYEMFSPGRVGTLANPRPSELGFSLVLRMFRNVCLEVERGEALDAVMPDGFAAYHSTPYTFGPDETRIGVTTVLSSTGDIDKDEDGGHPAIWLAPRTGGMTCTVEWTIMEEMSAISREAIAQIIAQWVPWELALVPASRPVIGDQSSLSDGIDWDRPCQGRWCPARIIYFLSRGDQRVSMEMTLNITDIEGERP